MKFKLSSMPFVLILEESAFSSIYNFLSSFLLCVSVIWFRILVLCGLCKNVTLVRSR